MDELLVVLDEIVRAEYAQWMRYIYLSSLGYGLDTDQLAGNFEEHAADELEHAAVINRWLVDLGGVPPTEVPPIEPMCGTIEDAAMWLFEYEVAGAKLYNLAHEMATVLGLHGLAHDIGKNLSIEHEHISDLQNLLEPHLISGDDFTMVMIANKFNKFAAVGGDLFNDLIIDKIIGFYRRADKEFPKTQQAFKFQEYFKSILDEATVAVSKGRSTEELQDDLPELTRQYMVQDIEKTVRELWPQRNKPEVKSALEFFRDTYEWLTADSTIERWPGIYTNYDPEWTTRYKEDWEQELEVGEAYQPSMGEIFQQLEPDEEEEAVEPTEEAVTIEDMPPELLDVPKAPSPELTTQPQEEPPDTRRPVTEAIEEKIKILDPDTKKKTLEVGVGDTVYNQSAAQIFKQNREYGINRNQANQYATGTIKEIREDSVLVEVSDVEEQFSEQIWPLDNRLWGSREEGERVVNQ